MFLIFDNNDVYILYCKLFFNFANFVVVKVNSRVSLPEIMVTSVTIIYIEKYLNTNNLSTIRKGNRKL